MDNQLHLMQRELKAAVKGAIESSKVSGHATSDHFPGVTKMIEQDYNRSVAL